MIHLIIYNTSYGRKKGQESKCQFDSRPLEVGNTSKYVHASGMLHIIGKLSQKATTFL